jgi:galactose mutarotase-like enzyme
MSAEIDPLGAQLCTLRDRLGRDWLWNGDPAVWSGRAPLLFPIVGALAAGHYRLGATEYALGRHGFARTSRFQTIHADTQCALLRLSADAASLQRYPFQFELDMLFALQGATLSMTATIHNRGLDPMPASFGYHPAFAWPLPTESTRSGHALQFERDEPAPIRRLDRDGLLSPARHATPIIDRRLALSDALFEQDVLILDQVHSRSVTYHGTHAARLRVDFPDAPYLGIWTKPGAHFICIEPWHGFADPQGYAGDFRAKPGSFLLSPSMPMTTTMSISLLTD